MQEFRRDGNDLHICHKIGLVEALCGFQFMLTHLDGRHLVIKYPPGKVIEPGEHRFIWGGGGQCFVLVFIEYFLGIVLVSFVRFYKGRPGGRNASVQKPVWERRSVHQVWCAISWERLDQHRETNGEFPALLMLLTKTIFF